MQENLAFSKASKINVEYIATNNPTVIAKKISVIKVPSYTSSKGMYIWLPLMTSIHQSIYFVLMINLMRND